MGLLTDGIAATLGAVNDRFLNAFPPPDEFFPTPPDRQTPLARSIGKPPDGQFGRCDGGDRLHPYKLTRSLPEALDEGHGLFRMGRQHSRFSSKVSGMWFSC